jgi:SEC-C motif-containing protein
MRSRYAAYAVRNAEYIIGTTHSSSPHKDPWHERWAEQICNFCDNMDFPHLTIHSSSQTETEGHVHFTAGLIAGSEDRSFTERSVFYKVNGRWLYHSGVSLENPL